MTKPYNPSVLLAHIEACLRQRKVPTLTWPARLNAQGFRSTWPDARRAQKARWVRTRRTKRAYCRCLCVAPARLCHAETCMVNSGLQHLQSTTTHSRGEHEPPSRALLHWRGGGSCARTAASAIGRNLPVRALERDAHGLSLTAYLRGHVHGAGGGRRPCLPLPPLLRLTGMTGQLTALFVVLLLLGAGVHGRSRLPARTRLIPH